MEHLLKGRSLGVRTYVRSSAQELRLELSAVNKKCHRSNKAATKKCKLDQISSLNSFRKKSKFKKDLVISGCTKNSPYWTAKMARRFFCNQNVS